MSSRRRTAAAGLAAAVVLSMTTMGDARAETAPPSSTTTTTTTAPPTTAPPTTAPAEPAPQPWPVPAPAPVTQPSVPVSTAPAAGAGLAEARAQYARLQEQADTALSEWSRAEHDLTAARTEMISAKLAADAAGADAEAARLKLSRRAASLYRSGGTPDLVEVLRAGDLDELGTRSKYMQTVVGADRELITRAVETRERLEDERTRYDGSVAAAGEVESRMRESRDRVEAALQQQGYLVAKIDRTARMPQARTGTGRVLAASGSRAGGSARYDMSVQPVVPPEGRVCPVGGPVTFSNDFGAGRSGPPPHPHQGNDVFAAYGTPLVAIADGVIFKSGNDGGLGGQRVWLRDNAGVTYYYAHMSRIDVTAGTPVVRGQVVGAVGNSGNARTTPSHVHFEMHPGGGKAVNPYGTLVRLC